ncbi:MAG: biopolymer transporter ExbD, partial [bacterium]|nr:biopolymer transporter ExbD [bacterium]
MARRRPRKSKRASSAINITPLGDVSLSLMLGFLVITPIIIETMATTLPQEGSGVSAGAVRQDPIVVLTAEGEILLNGKEVSEQELPGELNELLPAGMAGERKVMFTGAGDIAYRDVIHLLDVMRKNG